ncbi:CheR family methyltransferase [Oceaniglobus roseus]|uniref:CheR family methyltransferase n=1 Tax=Oceaniglobus roseus TaxID=1737570 RepID=UPI001561EC52|nr:CheR family methyltransferase [Kandeliimicrobium roseum]
MDTVDETTLPRIPICAIGASAGGTRPLREFFRRIPTDLGMAYVVIVHLAPDEPSALGEILGDVTTMEVRTVFDGPAIAPDTVYVISPDRELVIEGNSIASVEFREPRGKRAPIDMFFRSVARARGDGLAVILSGAGSDGAVGVRAVKEAGGVVFVQDPEEAQFAMMPRSSIAQGVADFVAPVEVLADQIVRVIRSKRKIGEMDEDDAEQTLSRILGFLHRSTGHDFSNYKRATMLRRVARRMQVNQQSTLEDYAHHLQTNPEEAKDLFSDLLISVTSFFRDPDAFETLAETVIGPMLDDLHEGGFRAWVAGCATGEEAYSLAMLIHEEKTKRGLSPEVQIFATDLDEGALATAREARYPASIAADVSDERLSKFFVSEGSHYRISKEIRDTVLFASHSVLKDPPFMRLDLISCRNLLIYLDRTVKRRVGELFAYGLRPNRFLFLGSAETMDSNTELFQPLHREARIFQLRRQQLRRPPQIGGFSSDSAMSKRRPVSGTVSEKQTFDAGGHHAQALERMAPPSMLVDRDCMIVHMSPNVGQYLLPPGGPLSHDAGDLVRPELRLDLRSAVRRAAERGQTTLTLPVGVAFDGGQRRVMMHVSPSRRKESDPVFEVLVVFLDGGPLSAIPTSERIDASDGEIQRLRNELEMAESHLAASRSEYETAIQDLRVVNEELQSMNEEYRSTSEELETSKEELQSMNEELQTVNAELKAKLESIGAAHSDLENLVMATDVGTLFLDTSLRIRIFTPQVAQIFRIAEGDIGRAITDFTHTLQYSGLGDDARQVLRDLTPVERETGTADNRRLMIRCRPYRTIDDRIDGVVFTFVDVTAQREAATRMRESERRFRALVDATSDVVFRMSPDLRDTQEIMGRGFPPNADAAGKDWVEAYILPEERESIRAMVEAAIAGRTPFETEHRVRLSDGNIGWRLTRAIPVEDEEGRIVEWFGAASDISARRRNEEDLRAARDALVLATRAADLGWGTWELGNGRADWDDRGREMLGLGPDDTRVSDWFDRVHADDRAALRDEIEAASREARSFDVEYRILRQDGLRIIHGTGAFTAPGADRPPRGSGLVRDVTELRKWEESQRLLVGELNHRVKNMLAVVQSIAQQTRLYSPDMDRFIAAFSARIGVLSEAHGALTRRNWSNADLRDLVERSLFSITDRDGGQVTLQGPHVALKPDAAISFTLAIHELCTNAVKYGALSCREGRVRVSWVRDGRTLKFDWVESDGPEVHPPTRTGFGSLILQQGLAYELDAEVDVDYDPAGLRYHVKLELHDDA